MAQRSEKTCPLGKLQYFGVAKGDYTRDKSGKTVEVQIIASLLSQTWTFFSWTVNLMKTFET